MKTILAKQYRTYMKEIEGLMKKDPKKGTRDGKRLDRLATACEAYEEKRWGKFFKAKPGRV